MLAHDTEVQINETVRRHLRKCGRPDSVELLELFGRQCRKKTGPIVHNVRGNVQSLCSGFIPDG